MDAPVSWRELRVDGDAAVGPARGPGRDRGDRRARTASTGAAASRSPTPIGRDATSWSTGCATSASPSRSTPVGNVVATRPGTDPDAAPVMTGSHIDTVATGGRFDGNLGVLAGLEVIETLDQHGVATAHPISVAFFTDEEGARFAPDMLGSLVYVGGMALEDALDVRAVDDGARLGDELRAHRLRRAGAVPRGRRTRRVRRAAHRAGADPRGRGRHHRRGRGRAGDLVDRAGDHRPLGPRRHHTDAACAATRLVAAAELTSFVRRLTGSSSAGSQVATVGRIDVHPNLVNVVPVAGHDHRRPAQHRRGRAAARPRPGSPAEIERVAAAEQVDHRDPLPRPLRAGRVRPGHHRPRRARPRSGSATRPGGCRAAPATTPRCSPGSARRR